MDSAADTLVAMYGINKLPKTLNMLITSMLYTLNKHQLIPETLDDINSLTSLDMLYDGTQKIQRGVQIPEMVGLQGNLRALQLAIALYPYIKNTEGFSKVELPMTFMSSVFDLVTKRHNQAQINLALKTINTLDLGYKVLQRTRDKSFNVFYILTYDTKDELLELLKENNFMTPSVLDKVL
jgi:hypothetical protein